MLPVDSCLRQTSILLARFAAHATGAKAYSLSQDARRGLRRRQQWSSIASYAIRVEEAQVATLEFSFDQDPIPEAKRALLDQMAAAIETVQALPHSIASMAARAASLDVELAEIKISERTRGLMMEQAAAEDAVESIVRHVEQIRDRCELGVIFERLLPYLEDRVAERKLLVKAKRLLQDRHGISEQQAYLLLRNRSRSTRTRLRQVAEETISQSPKWAPEIRQDLAL
jgi:hypothetical protein